MHWFPIKPPGADYTPYGCPLCGMVMDAVDRKTVCWDIFIEEAANAVYPGP